VSQEGKSKGKVEQAKGKLKETAGKVTGNDRLKGEGQAEQFKGRARAGVESAKDSVHGAVAGLRGEDKGQQDERGDKNEDDERA